ncbi:hypothetical protein ASPWEDRAFT_169297 [Aspergillus wentii DTO 134E9]|uniref:HTH CENPB-type domain-containing protein n=1 Tax=Aspergillus wentii DTO 134E9 TaxID=1073089 RepID=A0A1L9RWZ7_ASPWE|nr:uncharacterized protein ASPWEDRAFT_169297 [Aspergillus wentii DTO 134E9]KAI9931863.1 hypothetical protein MW887_010447 [Aspergillus wentii]OJJ39452.1 hypothetical protein ASPWEDRAFT_169297 [Aspergillus wentii DTO 134E9]
MDTESHHTRDNEFPHSHSSHSHWMDMPPFNSSQQSPPLPDYQGFHYGSSPVMPLDSSFGMSIPPPYSSLPLTMPSHPWPSLLASHQQQPPPPPHYQEAGLPPMHIPPSISPAGPIPPPRKSSTGGTNPRRTLTDDDRRRMCLYHEENKTAKQTDIGALFGVERSTVSKVLRQKEKYLNPDDGSRSPIKRSKGRVPDIEKALSNWARNYQRQGYPLNDEMIREKALFFASTCGCPEGKEKVLSRSWLEKFKQKNSLMGAKSRKSSFDTVKSDSDSPIRLSIDSALASAMQSPTSVLSPISPTATGFATPSPLSPTQSQENMKKELVDSLAQLSEYQQHVHSKSTTSLETTSSVSAGITSPTSTLVSDSPFTPTSQSRISPTDNNASRPRSQTLPSGTYDPNAPSTDESKEQMASQAALQQALSVALPQSPIEDEKPASILDAPNIIKRNRSNPEIKTKSIYPPFYSKSNTVSPVSPPGSPTQDEARNALELVMNYFQHQPTGLGAQEYVTIGKLMERLELAKSHHTTLPGGLTRIDEHEDAPHLIKKRSIHSLG